MPEAVVEYDKDLPEIPDRQAHLEPSSYLLKKKGTENEWEEIEGRRPSDRLLVAKLRAVVDDWRNNDYPGASALTRRLFSYWFDEDHLVNNKVFRYYFGQREAVETLIYLIEVWKEKDVKPLIETFGHVNYPDGSQRRLPGTDIMFPHTVGGKRQILRYVPEISKETIQELPPENLRRYAFKMATGSGKTVLMAMIVVWSYFHRRLAEDSGLATNFLVVAPNVIVYQRLQKDFADNKIFNSLPLIPPELRSQWNLQIVLRGDNADTGHSENLFLTNIQQLYESRIDSWTPENAVAAILGRAPKKDLPSNALPMLDRIRNLKDLIVINDEAHHVHDQELQWHKTLISIHEALPVGVSMWLDFSATPKDQNGTYFPWIICDYPLQQAVEDRIIKAPIIGHFVKRRDPDQVTEANLIESYEEWLRAALTRWQDHEATYKPLGLTPVLFIMVEKTVFANRIYEWLVNSEDALFKEDEVLVIHTDVTGEVKGDIDTARAIARDIDNPESKIKVIVSVLMLREGWDVRSVTVVLGLRPFTSKARILPEQAIGRGLRLMEGISPDRTQTLEVMGTEAFEAFVRQLEAEGVGLKTLTEPPIASVRIYPVAEKLGYDISIPLPRPIYTHNYSCVSEIDVFSLEPIYTEEELNRELGSVLELKFASTDTRVHAIQIEFGKSKKEQEILASITNKVISAAKLTGPDVFAMLFPKVRDYVAFRCFGQALDLRNRWVLAHLSSYTVQNKIAKHFARAIGQLTVERRSVEFECAHFRLSETKPFIWRRNLPLQVCTKTVFNLVATYNNYERAFAEFLDHCADVPRFSALGSTEQDSGSTFRVDYLKPSGAIGFYYPDWVVVQQCNETEVYWIVETKGRIWESTSSKDEAIDYWCQSVSEQTGTVWRYVRINQSDFIKGHFLRFEDLPGVGRV
ncbi:MAG: DEAD/DEAH box helicase family protein [Halobacteriota archaeon]